MELNPSKCSNMRVTRPDTPFIHNYILRGHILESLNEIKYLGVTISSNLEWKKHIANITSKANTTLGMLRRNLRNVPQAIKEKAYIALVRPKVEYAPTVWDPHTARDINEVEKVQRRAARFVCHSYHNTSSVNDMLDNIGWPSLQHRRTVQRLCMLYKIHYRLVDIPIPNYIQPAQVITRYMNPLSYTKILSTRDYFAYQFFPRTIFQWNCLPAQIVSIPTIEAFRSSISPLNFTTPPFIYNVYTDK